jgi:hypothetical protein
MAECVKRLLRLSETERECVKFQDKPRGSRLATGVFCLQPKSAGAGTRWVTCAGLGPHDRFLAMQEVSHEELHFITASSKPERCESRPS